uniref:ZSWIM8 TPR repeats domain-containing protein n=1 Tax=Caenorhabditis japonica TaxID=281687 RepID=A0A8R1HYP4_CAEJA
MSDFDLRRLVQWHLNEIPRKCIPGFQKLIDQIKDPKSMINNLDGAPDPTDGGHEPVSRYDFPEIESKIRRLLCRYCIPAPAVHCDVQYLSTSNHNPMHIEWNTIMRPFRSREPEGMWNLLHIIREMFARNDDNAVALLRTVTDECLSNSQVLLWWYTSKLVQSGGWNFSNHFKVPSPQCVLSQLNCSHLFDEIVTLWKLVAMNPRAGKFYRSQLAAYLQDYHRTAVRRLKNMISMTPPTADDAERKTDATILSNHQTSTILNQIVNIETGGNLTAASMKFTLNCFPGFYSAIQMCNYLNDKDIKLAATTDAIFYVSAVSYYIKILKGWVILEFLRFFISAKCFQKSFYAP